MTADKLPDSRYGVICAEHGKQGLSEDDYHYQMMKPDSFWSCPLCRGYADWDDERCEASFEDSEDEQLEEEQTNTGELPKVYTLTLKEHELTLLGTALAALEISISSPTPVQRAAAQLALTVAADSIGWETMREQLKALIQQVHILIGHEKCPDCGEYHE